MATQEVVLPVLSTHTLTVATKAVTFAVFKAQSHSLEIQIEFLNFGTAIKTPAIQPVRTVAQKEQLLIHIQTLTVQQPVLFVDLTEATQA